MAGMPGRMTVLALTVVILLAVPIVAGGSARATAPSSPKSRDATPVAGMIPVRDAVSFPPDELQDSPLVVRRAIREPVTSGSPVIGAGWDALSFGASDLTPPDVQVAVGPTNVIEAVNLALAVYTKQGTLIGSYDLATFFGTGPDYITDPQVQYDAMADRWFVTLTEGTTGQVLVAVSQAGSPTGAWWFYAAPGSPTPDCPDQPILGVGAINLIFSVNLFSNSCQSTTYSYLGAEFWVINKTDLIMGASTASTWVSAADVNNFSIHPTKMEGNSPTQYMVATYWPGSDLTSSILQLFAVSGSPPGAVTILESDLSMPTASLAPSADQRESASLLDSGDIRIADAVWSPGELWLAFEEECVHPGLSPTACIRLMELDPAAATILQDFDLSSPTQHYFYPALAVDAHGSLAVVFGYSSGADYPGIMATGRLPGDPPGLLQVPVIVRVGTGPETTWCPLGLCRYGDYFGASFDPADPASVWLAGEFGRGASGWGTYIFRVRIKAMITVSYAIRGGSLPPTGPIFRYLLDGVIASGGISSVPTTFLADPGTSWSIDATLSSPYANVRYNLLPADVANLSGTADRSFSESITYQTQYLLVVLPNTALVAALVQGGGWFDSGAPAMIFASGNESWRFRGWKGVGTGSYTGVSMNATVAVLEPIVEVATFEPGITIEASSGGSVGYSFGTMSGTVPAASSQTVYVPLGSLVNLTAQPTSPVWTFSRWVGVSSTSQSTASVPVSGPTSLKAVFEPNWVLLLGAPAAGLSAGILLVILPRRRRRKAAHPAPASPTAPPPPPAGPAA